MSSHEGQVPQGLGPVIKLPPVLGLRLSVHAHLTVIDKQRKKLLDMWSVSTPGKEEEINL